MSLFIMFDWPSLSLSRISGLLLTFSVKTLTKPFPRFIMVSCLTRHDPLLHPSTTPPPSHPSTYTYKSALQRTRNQDLRNWSKKLQMKRYEQKGFIVIFRLLKKKSSKKDFKNVDLNRLQIISKYSAPNIQHISNKHISCSTKISLNVKVSMS